MQGDIIVHTPSLSDCKAYLLIHINQEMPLGTRPKFACSHDKWA